MSTSPPRPSEPLLYIDGAYLPASQAALPALDRAVRFGDGLFETYRCSRGTIPFFEGHWGRLEGSASFLRIPLPATAARVREISVELARRNGMPDAVLRVTVTRGVGPRTLWFPEKPSPSLLMECIPLSTAPAAPMRIHVSSLRQSADSPFPRHKTLNRIDRVMASQEAREAGADEALFLNTRGEVAEGTTMSVFWVRDGVLYTPALDTNILPGVTRGVLLRLAREAGIRTVEGRFPLSELEGAGEVFVTSAVRGVHPVARVGSREFPLPAGVASRLSSLYLKAAFGSPATPPSAADRCAEGACEVP